MCILQQPSHSVRLSKASFGVSSHCHDQNSLKLFVCCVGLQVLTPAAVAAVAKIFWDA
jgi:hypothetical protein